MNVLVVGGAGYIGSHTCKALRQKGYVPIVYDNLQNGHKWAAGSNPLVVGDLLDPELLDQTFKTYKPLAVLHFASSIDCRASMNQPALYYRNNVVGSLNLLDAMQKNGVLKLVFSSTAAVYGFPESEKITESHPCKPVNVYGNTKWMVEQIIHDFEKAYGLAGVILRYFNAAGADRDGELGEAHHPETHFIPLAIQTALEKQTHLNVFGDGSAIRDYIHVSDLANAHVKALEWLLNGKGPMTLNLGTGKGYSLNEVLEMVEKVAQKPIKRVLQPKNPNEPFKLIADPTEAQKALDWTPALSDLETIVSTAYNWHKRQGS
ncbi:MAG: UDP-glucose 4-epimerase GalE [Rhabdochlamydiaceae bacterium]|nr:UDP-glucose 4-epimerase GalE [Rhabdochlamydiaceae bacterium]